MSKYYRVYADVDLDAIRANCIELMSKTEPSTKALAVVKADGYGHGDVAVSKAVRDLVYGYAVATLDEAVNLRENGINKPILILGYVEPEEYEALVKNEIDATVFDYETAKALNDVALRLGKVAFCHIKVDTGMRRIGLEPDESGVEIVKKIKNLKALNARGLYDAFDDALKKEGISFEIKHVSNSAAIIDMPQANHGMVRLGIALYGMYPSDEVDKSAVALKPALQLKSHVAMVKEKR